MARYADRDGYEKDGPRPYAYLYRDWVISALNQDTLACAECHAHKFDPISQREFCQFHAFFNNVSETGLPLPTDAEKAAHEAAVLQGRHRLDELEAQLARLAPEVVKAAAPNRETPSRDETDELPAGKPWRASLCKVRQASRLYGPGVSPAKCRTQQAPSE